MKSNDHSDKNEASTLQDLFDRLPGEVLNERDGWVSNCPNGRGHRNNDAHPSLRIAVAKNGTVLVKCRAGCKTGDVLAAIGLTLYDLATMEPGDVHVRGSAGPSQGPGASHRAGLAKYIDETSERLQGGSDLATEALRYLQERFGIGPQDANALELGVDPGGGAHDFAGLLEQPGRPGRAQVLGASEEGRRPPRRPA